VSDSVRQDVIAVPDAAHVFDDDQKVAVPRRCERAVQPVRIATIKADRVAVLIRDQQVKIGVSVAQDRDLSLASAIERHGEKVGVAGPQAAERARPRPAP